MKKSIILLSMSLIVSLVGCDKNNPSTSEVNEETFAFVAIVGGLFMCKNKKDLLFKFFVPTMIPFLTRIL